MNELSYLLSTALFIGTVHTFIGVDHYLPFVVLSKANNWSIKKTSGIVFVCGLGHVLSSVLLGFVGLAISSSLSSLVGIEDVRGTLATYFIIAFGFGYTIYALHNLLKHRPHKHLVNGQEIMHDHHDSSSVKDHIQDKKKSNIIWGLFILFVLGPCEPLIPILMYPAATLNLWALVSVTAVFSISTIGMMLILTLLGIKGLSFVKLKTLDKYGETLAGLAIMICGVLMITLGI
jgi:nickel/cobalt transporter (NicO) family protein